eukprot:10572675-Heterocapsa_arctica.AAC.1
MGPAGDGPSPGRAGAVQNGCALDARRVAGASRGCRRQPRRDWPQQGPVYASLSHVDADDRA